MIRGGSHPGRRSSRVRNRSEAGLPGPAAAGWLCWLFVLSSCGDGGPGTPSALPANPSGATPAPTASQAPPPAPAPAAIAAQTPGLKLTAAPTAVFEDGGAATVTVTATAATPVTTAVTVTLAVGDGTATSADYGAEGGSLVIPVGAAKAEGTVVITPTDDLDLEGAETVVVSGTAAGWTVESAEVTIRDPAITAFFADEEFEIREGETQDIAVRYQVADLRSPWSLVLLLTPGTASEDDYRSPVGIVRIPAGQLDSGEVTVPLTAVSDLSFDEDAETFTVALSQLPGIIPPRTKLGSELAVTIAEGGTTECRGIVIEADPPRSRSGRVRSTTVEVRVPLELADVTFDWTGPYHDDEENPERRRRYPLLEMIVAEWQVSADSRETRHSFEIEWPLFAEFGRFSEVGLRPYLGAEPCDVALACSDSRCATRRR